VLGTPALFSTAYGNVGSSIYYALGVTAAIALGLTPLVFVISGLIFAYAEGTVRYPEAGGSSSFARHAFNELISFGAAWAQMLNYIITVAISAFFVPHYLSIFWEPLKTNPWDIIGGAAVILILVAINIVGIKEAAGLNVFLAVVDFATQVVLVIVGFAIVFDPHVLTSNVHWGVAPTWANFALAVPVAMIAYTGIETVSNLAEEARNPTKSIPASIRLVAVAVFAIYFTLPMIALSALPVYKDQAGDYVTKLGLPPDQGGFENDPVLGLVENLGLHGWVLSTAKVYVGVLAATILFIATNAGVIGASRITYSMATYRQLPEVFRRLHPRFKTPWMSLIVFAAAIPIAVLLPGKVDFLGTMYAFGAMLSFTIAHASIVRLRQMKQEPGAYRARPNLRIGKLDLPLFALIGGLGTAIAWTVVVVQYAPARWAGLGWLVAGFGFYWVYRRRVVHRPLTETVRAPLLVVGPSLSIEYRTIVVPVKRTGESEEALVAAARLAAERGATVVVVHVMEVPLSLPLDARLDEDEDAAEALLDDAQALVESYGVRAVTRLLRARKAGPAIVDEARRRDAELVLLGAPRQAVAGRRALFGGTVDYVLRESPCRVLVAAGKRAA
jgi:APA family basic amino acid/polyamine antiporter